MAGKGLALERDKAGKLWSRRPEQGYVGQGRNITHALIRHYPTGAMSGLGTIYGEAVCGWQGVCDHTTAGTSCDRCLQGEDALEFVRGREQAGVDAVGSTQGAHVAQSFAYQLDAVGRLLSILGWHALARDALRGLRRIHAALQFQSTLPARGATTSQAQGEVMEGDVQRVGVYGIAQRQGVWLVMFHDEHGKWQPHSEYPSYGQAWAMAQALNKDAQQFAERY